MKQLHISLFGKLCIQYGGSSFAGCEARKVQELLCYLLLRRDRPQAREMLASMLWGDHCTTSQSKKYLRDALWRLQSALKSQPGFAATALLHAEADWIELRSIAELWLDVAIFEEAYAAAKDIPGANLDDGIATLLQSAVKLHKDFLLANWYQDWCLCERERLHQIYLIMIDKLMGYCEAHHDFEAGLAYGRRILQYDRAREHTHQQMMRLYYLTGYRAGALRQYERCVAALKEELDVGPARSTRMLYELIRDDRLNQWPARPGAPGETAAARDVLTCLRRLQDDLSTMQRRLERATNAAKCALEGPLAAKRLGEPDEDGLVG